MILEHITCTTSEFDYDNILKKIQFCRDGTTDISRTFHFGSPTINQKEFYTRVLKGQIAIATLKFPNRTRGHVIDSFAREALWSVGLDYGHGKIIFIKFSLLSICKFCFN